MRTATTAEMDNQPTDLFVTTAAMSRRQRPPNLQAEAAAFRELSKVLADDPRAGVRHVLEVARHLCGAGTAGLSLLRRDEDAKSTIRWEAVSGALVQHEGAEARRDCSPCGLCLDASETILVWQPGRAFHRLSSTAPSIIEDLIVPLYDSAGTALGTLWVAHHDSASHFSADDARIVEQLAGLMVLTLRLMGQARERQHALALLESHQTAQQNLLAYDLRREHSRHKRVENGYLQTLSFKDALIHEVNHRAKNTLQAAASLLSLSARASATAEVREALLDSYRRLQLLAKAHELLYSNADNAQTVLMPKLLETLGDALQQSFSSAHANVRLELTCDPVALPAQQAIPLALFANEAVTNAYKHAFPDNGSGRISLHLQQVDGNGLILRIADDGVGLQRDGTDDGMGLKLIGIFATQLRGTLDTGKPVDGPGTCVTLTIRREANPAVGSLH